ncbi:hypothetical protein BDV95DRAFT_532262 [Massariosphaeria phaeospora]|uniref:DUF4419 domain-containing protein n=1 Tax=Massariosphaeria phaeospora TaxID=100035 RepID=A0A7C8I5I2_9PLEO|nr:hypothetical protein BDV95DRAFT_532262 [Massariosphaeria phaeospora]
MPVTIRPSPDVVGKNADTLAVSAQDLLYRNSRYESDEDYNEAHRFYGRHIKPIMHSSCYDVRIDSAAQVVSYNNGFADGIIRAFQQDLHLVLRPDDLWLAILTQFSFYVNGHAEELRSQFVKHEGKKLIDLGIVAGSLESLQVDKVSRMFSAVVEEHLVDAEFRNWLVPDFSTTTDNDVAVASMVMMATMQKYFNYECTTGCGLPSVTLLGDVTDWEKIVVRLDRLKLYGEQPTEWLQLLLPIAKRCVETFKNPDSEDLKSFWMHVVHAEAERGSGDRCTYTGWITAFAFWNDGGQRIRHHTGIWHTKKTYELDGVTYPIVSQSSGIPSGLVEVPVVVKALERGIEYDTRVIAGSVGMSVSGGDGDVEGEKGKGTTVQPRTGWWMLEYGQKPLIS